jgi:hypothetical protein
MAGSDSGLSATPEKRTGFSLKNFGRSLWAEISTAGKTPAITQLGLAPGQDNAGAAPGATQPDATANIPGNTVYTPLAGTVLTAETQTPFTPMDIEDRAGLADAKREALQSAGAPDRQGEPETRTYKGATYVKGADREWHLQETQTSEVNKETPAIAWPMPAPIADDTALSATELNAESQPAPAKAAPAQTRKPAPEAKPAPRKAPAKAPAKPPVEAAAKPPAKAAAKVPAKAPAPKSAHAKGKPAPATNSKAGKVSHAAKPSKPAAKKPAPKPAKKR